MKIIVKDKKGNVRMSEKLNDSDFAYDKNGKKWVGNFAFPIEWDIDFIDGNYVVTGTK